MKELLKKYVEANLISQKGPWYYHNGETIGNVAKAGIALQDLISSGKLEKLGIEATNAPKKIDVQKINPALTDTTQTPENIKDFWKEQTAALGDIESHSQGGRFRTYIFGVDGRYEKHPVIKAHPFVYRHNELATNVKDGLGLKNRSWTVFSKKLNPIDPRTKKLSITFQRDDTPEEDFVTVGKTVLVYAEKSQYIRKNVKRTMRDKLKTTKQADQRQELAEKSAILSGTDVEASVNIYSSSNTSDSVKDRENMQENQNMSMAEAEAKIDQLSNITVDSPEYDAAVKELNALAESPNVGKTLKSSRKLSDII